MIQENPRRKPPEQTERGSGLFTKPAFRVKRRHIHAGRGHRLAVDLVDKSPAAAPLDRGAGATVSAMI